MVKDGMALSSKKSGRSGRTAIFAGTLVFAAAGFALRLVQLRRAYDETGLPTGGSIWTVLLCVCSALAALWALLFCGGLPKRQEFARCFPQRRLCIGVLLAGAALLLAGSAADVVRAIPGPGEALSVAAILPGFAGIFGALAMLLAAAGRLKGAKPQSALYLVPFFFLVIRLIVDFKGGWSSDPTILDYCFDLFAMLAAMTAAYHLAGFCYDRGRRGRTAFWCLTGAYFCIVSLADGGVGACLRFGGLALWQLANAWQLLGPAARGSAPASGTPEAPEAPEEA